MRNTYYIQEYVLTQVLTKQVSLYTLFTNGKTSHMYVGPGWIEYYFEQACGFNANHDQIKTNTGPKSCDNMLCYACTM
jgi:hypothetical protein